MLQHEPDDDDPSPYASLSITLLNLEDFKLRRQRLIPAHFPAGYTEHQAEEINFAVTYASPLWSPDGQYLAYVAAMGGPSSDLYLYDVEADESVRLTDGPNNIFLTPGWSPDGKWIVHAEWLAIYDPEDEERHDTVTSMVWVARDFFERMDPSLSRDEQMAHFNRFRDTLGLFASVKTDMSDGLFQTALSIFFNGFTSAESGNQVPQSLGKTYGAGRDEWESLWFEGSEPNAAQYMNLGNDDLLGAGYRTHYNLCGQLAAFAALGLDLQEGLELFLELESSRPVFDENGNYKTSEAVTGDDILLDPFEGTYPWQLEEFMENVSGTEYTYAQGESSTPPYNVDEMAQLISDEGALIALVNIDKDNSGKLERREDSDDAAAHWVTMTGILPTGNGGAVVRIYNPYNNQEQLYTWSDFENAWASTPGNSSEYLIVAPDEE